MIAPPERKPSVKTDKRDSERIVREDALDYVRRCYIPSQYAEGLRFIVSKQMEIGEKISRAKDQIHALIERNMLQSEFEDLSDVFGSEGLERLASLQLPLQEMTVLAMYLEELRLYTSEHNQIETDIAKIAQSDQDCQLHGDLILKYALTCGVNGAGRTNADSAVKRFYLKQLKKGKSPQDAEVAAARKLACIVWKILTSKQRYVEEDKYLTARKMKKLSYIANRALLHVTKAKTIPRLISDLKNESDVLGTYTKEMHRLLEHKRKHKKGSASPSSDLIARGDRK